MTTPLLCATPELSLVQAHGLATHQRLEVLPVDPRRAPGRSDHAARDPAGPGPADRPADRAAVGDGAADVGRVRAAAGPRGGGGVCRRRQLRRRQQGARPRRGGQDPSRPRVAARGVGGPIERSPVPVRRRRVRDRHDAGARRGPGARRARPAGQRRARGDPRRDAVRHRERRVCGGPPRPAARRRARRRHRRRPAVDREPRVHRGEGIVRACAADRVGGRRPLGTVRGTVGRSTAASRRSDRVQRSAAGDGVGPAAPRSHSRGPAPPAAPGTHAQPPLLVAQATVAAIVQTIGDRFVVLGRRAHRGADPKWSARGGGREQRCRIPCPGSSARRARQTAPTPSPRRCSTPSTVRLPSRWRRFSGGRRTRDRACSPPGGSETAAMRDGPTGSRA